MNKKRGLLLLLLFFSVISIKNVDAELFNYSGTVLNSSYNAAKYFNVSFSRLSFGQGGPPTRVVTFSGLTGNEGNFTALNLDTTKAYSVTVKGNSSEGNVTEILLETEPYSGAHLNATRAVGINATYITSLAASVNISFVNSTGSIRSGAGVCMIVPGTATGNARIDFSDMVYEQFESTVNSSVIDLPTNTSIGCMFFGGMPSAGQTPTFSPRYLGFTTNVTAGEIDEYQVNTSTVLVNITGNFTFVNNFSVMNVTFLESLIVFPFGGSYLVPPGSSFTNTPFINNNDSTFRVEVASPGGLTLDYLIRAVASDNASAADQSAGNVFMVGFGNATVSGSNVDLGSDNLTFMYTTGSFASSQTDVNATKYKINAKDKDGAAVGDMHGELLIQDENLKKNLLLMLEDWASGSIRFLLPNTSNVTLRTFGEGGPKEFKLNITHMQDVEYNITLENDFRNFGVAGNETDLSASEMDSKIKVSLYKTGTVSGVDCNAIPPDPGNCLLVGNIPPTGMKSVATNKGLNMLINDTGSNTLLYFINAKTDGNVYSVRTSGTPITENTTAGVGFNETHRLFSSAVRTYDEVKIGKRVNNIDTTNLNTTNNITVLFNNVVDNNQKTVWNNTVGSGNENATGLPSDYTNFPQEFFNRSRNGVTCGTNNTADLCYLNVTNSSSGIIWLQGNSSSGDIIHFSGFDPEVSGATTLTTSTTTTTTTSGGSTTTTTSDVLSPTPKKEDGFDVDFSLEDAEEVNIRGYHGREISLSFDGTTEHTITLTKVDSVNQEVTLTIASDPIEITIKVGEIKEVDVDEDEINDLAITLNSITAGLADLTFKNLVIEQQQVEGETGELVEEVTEGTEKEGINKTWLWILVVIVIIIVYFGLTKKKKH